MSILLTSESLPGSDILSGVHRLRPKVDMRIQLQETIELLRN